jgi:Tfp pilus assembly protein PilF
VDTVVLNKRQPFVYATGVSTVASETWRARKGDCLSLTVLTYAMAQELRLPAVVQEPRSFTLFDRRGTTDYRIGHVNVFVDRLMGVGDAAAISLTQGIVIDFEPSYSSTRMGVKLSGRGILARYYNNLAAEYLAANDDSMAYAHFKAAIAADPEFVPARTNLAGLYRSLGYTKEAEQVLVIAVGRSGDTDSAISALYRLLVAQGRVTEASKFEALRQARQEREPYYWIDEGIGQIDARNYRSAVKALEKAQELATGFSEVHRYLAFAYLQNGQPDKAQEQLAALALIDSGDPALGIINRKILAARKAGSMVSSKTSL